MRKKKCSIYDSVKWLTEHYKDYYVQRAQKTGVRSRAWFKLDEINHMDSLLCIGMKILDLGSSPGSWSLYAKEKIGNTGCIIACDILPMKRIDGVNFLKGDCLDPNFRKMLFLWTGYKKIHIVLSDMAPNTTGISIIDSNRSINLGNVALNICRYVLVPGGNFLVKIFQGIEFDRYLYNIRTLFRTVKIRKPSASRSCSREVYIVAKECKYD